MTTSGPTDHRVVLRNREFLEISGVRHVESFDESSVVLETTLGLLQVRGNGLHVNQLSLEQEKLEVEGDIAAILYSDNRDQLRGKGFLARLLR